MDKVKFGIIIILCLTMPLVYLKGKSTGANEVRQYYIQADQNNQKYFINKINKLNESANVTIINQQIKYESLQNDFVKTSANLANCKYTIKQLRTIQSSANVHTSTNSSMDNAARTGESTNFESFNCQDAGITMIAWSKQYFSCKTKLDYLQGIFK